MTRIPKRPRDPAQLAKLMVDIATGEVEETRGANPSGAAQSAAVSGKKGGLTRAANMSPERRSEASRLAADKRWAAKSD